MNDESPKFVGQLRYVERMEWNDEGLSRVRVTVLQQAYPSWEVLEWKDVPTEDMT